MLDKSPQVLVSQGIKIDWNKINLKTLNYKYIKLKCFFKLITYILFKFNFTKLRLAIITKLKFTKLLHKHFNYTLFYFTIRVGYKTILSQRKHIKIVRDQSFLYIFLHRLLCVYQLTFVKRNLLHNTAQGKIYCRKRGNAIKTKVRISLLFTCLTAL